MRSSSVERKLKRVLKGVPVQMHFTQGESGLRVKFTAVGETPFVLWRIIQQDETMPEDHPQAAHHNACDGYMQGCCGPAPCPGFCQIGWTVTYPYGYYTVVQCTAIERLVVSEGTRHPYRSATRAIEVELNAEWIDSPYLNYVGWFVKSLLGLTATVVGVRDAWDDLSV